MATVAPQSSMNVGRLIAVPAAISLAVTVLRVAGELGHWSDRWFEPVTRGIVPSGVSWCSGSVGFPYRSASTSP